jgi:hypothetical protein
MGLSKFCMRIWQVKQVPVEGKDHFDHQCLQNLKHNPETDEAKCAREKLFQEIANDEKLFRSFQSELRRREVDRHQIMCTHASVSMAIHSKEVLGRLGELALRRRASLIKADQLSQDEKSQASKDISMSSSKVKRQHEKRRRSLKLFGKITAQCTFSAGKANTSERERANSEIESGSVELPDEEQHYEEGENFVAPDIWEPIGKRHTTQRKTTRKYTLDKQNDTSKTSNLGDSDGHRRWRPLRFFDGKKNMSHQKDFPGEARDPTVPLVEDTDSFSL